MKKIFSLLLLASSVAHASGASEVNGARELKAALQPVETLQGVFDQTIKDKHGKVVQASTGEFSIKRPGYFFWKTGEPYPQTIVGNPEKLWIYDPDLEQATVRPQEEPGHYNPSKLLSGDVSGLEKAFDIEHSVRKDSQVFTLRPKEKNAQYRQIELRFDAKAPTSFSFSDKLNQVTEVTFTKREVNTSVDSAKFDFAPPEGTDIIVDE